MVTRRLQRAARKVVERVAERALVAAFDAWRSAAANSRRRLALSARGAARVFRRALASGWRHWIERVVEARELRSVAERALGKLLNRALVGSWRRWCGTGSLSLSRVYFFLFRALASRTEGMRPVGPKIQTSSSRSICTSAGDRSVIVRSDPRARRLSISSPRIPAATLFFIGTADGDVLLSTSHVYV